MSEPDLQGQLTALASEHEVPGAAAGVCLEGAEHYGFHGVTSVENPLPVDETTLFQYGSTQKTYTATAIMRLVDQGLVDLHAPVRTYVPELKLKDENVARDVTVLNLLNHTSGWQGDAFTREATGDGDDALGRFVQLMADLEQTTPLGEAFSYNNAALGLAGHLIARVTNKTYEQAMKDLIYEPLGLSNTFFFPNDVMTRRFAVGHHQDAEGDSRVTRPWAMSRAGAPSGGFGVCSTAPDQIAWAKFHLGDGTAPDGTRVLSKELLDLMKEPTFSIPGSAVGNSVGISWLLDDIDGVGIVGHGGDVRGQHSDFVMVPKRDFAVAVLTNCDLTGSLLKEAVVKWALEAYLGLARAEPEPVTLPDAELEAYVGRYETIAVWVDISANNGGLVINVEPKPETIKQLSSEGEVPDQPPIPIGLLEGPGDRYIVTDGPAKGMKGYFVRDDAGSVSSAHIGGRLAMRATSRA